MKVAVMEEDWSKCDQRQPTELAKRQEIVSAG